MVFRKRVKKQVDTQATNEAVGGGNQMNQFFVGKNTKKLFSRKKVLIVLGALVVVAFVAGGVTLLLTKAASVNQCRGEATSPLYTEAQESISKLFNDDLKNSVEKIKKQKNFEKDANCLYPLVVHYIRTDDLENAEKYYEKLQLSFNDKIGIAKVYGNSSGRKTIRDLSIPISDLRLRKESSNAKLIFPSVQ